MKRRLPIAFCSAIALVLTACGGTTVKTVTKTTVVPSVVRAQPAPLVGAQKRSTAEIARLCPPGHSSMGCSVRPAPGTQPPRAFLAPPRGLLFPDVYEGQGTVNWQSVKDWQAQHGWRAAAIFKMGEFREDFQAQRNASETQRLGFWRSGYWFVRSNLGCQGEADAITAEARKLHILIVSLDLEVPEAHGYGACLSPVLRARGFIVVEYTSPGSNPGGVDTSDPLWIATFGSGFSCIWTCHPVAWQYTDGTFGAVTFVPGIGHDDTNVDLGITSLGAPPPDPYALYLKNVWTLKFGVRASEYNTAKAWDLLRCGGTSSRHWGIGCRSTFFHLELLRDRLYFVAHHRVVHGHWVAVRSPRWPEPKGHPSGSRYAGVAHRLAQRRR